MKHRVRSYFEPVVLDWLANRGGLAVWASVDLCDPGKVWTTPVLDASGKPTTKPSWQAAEKPCRIITDADEVEVVVPKEVKRFPVAVRMGASGTRIKLTDASAQKLSRALDAAGLDSWHEFDLVTQEAVIYIPGEKRPLKRKED